MNATTPPSNFARLKDFRPTVEQLDAAQKLAEAMAWEATVRPVVEGYQRRILAENKWAVATENRDAGTVPEAITDPKWAWLMEDSDFEVYHQLCDQARMETGLYVAQDGNCPLSVAEFSVIKAKWHLADMMEPITQISRDQICGALPDVFNTYFELNLRLFAPYLKSRTPAELEAIYAVPHADEAVALKKPSGGPGM